MKTGLEALGTAENDSGSTKHEIGPGRDRTPSILSKMSSGAQNMKTGPDALGTAENESESGKYENGT
jgi:hypothetical protein